MTWADNGDDLEESCIGHFMVQAPIFPGGAEEDLSTQPVSGPALGHHTGHTTDAHFFMVDIDYKTSINPNTSLHRKCREQRKKFFDAR
jgi:hypothetical protein